LSESLTRARFEELNNDLFKNTLAPVKQVLEDGGFKKNQIDEIVLVGGSTRIPKVQQLIKKEAITITNDKGRLSQEEIDRMIQEAEQFADEDQKVKERVDAKNGFENYLHSMKVAVEGSGDNKGLSEKLDDEEKEQVNEALKDGQDWLMANPEAEAEDLKEKHKEIESTCAPIISKHYQGGAAGGDEEDDEEIHDEL